MTFPTEVAELVIDACDNSSTLASCASVSRAWHNRAVFRLFERQTIHVVGLTALEAFLSTISHPLCTIHSSIRSISISSVTSLNGFIPILAGIPNLTSLQLTGDTLLNDAAQTTFKQSLYDLRHLSLDITFPTSTAAISLVCSLPLLESLSLHGRWVGALSPPPLDLPATIHTISLGGMLDDILLWLLSRPPPPALSFLQFRDVGTRQSLRSVLEYLPQVSKTVTVFRFSIADIGTENHFTHGIPESLHFRVLHTLSIDKHYANPPRLLILFLMLLDAPNLEFVSINSLGMTVIYSHAWTHVGVQLLEHPKLCKFTVRTNAQHHPGLRQALRALDVRDMLELLDTVD
ncbi:ATP-dependent DNA helicase [Mycena indigotica]|uniref:ATP-dependent DNA helicase n=1 Tax=Mycena indigotica TaxID=2126181 RepID=A0A8H6TBJ9_9AGAR|nr:ATP-dependent DNA helicase [Mycena indigotica]KAF7315508.1 ATP-dependent DNA helicase [Mycena indigotica]